MPSHQHNRAVATVRVALPDHGLLWQSPSFPYWHPLHIQARPTLSALFRTEPMSTPPLALIPPVCHTRSVFL